jgi:hypothetical protein
MDEAFEQAAPGAVHIITRRRDAIKNLRTGHLPILPRAGVTSWRRLERAAKSASARGRTQSAPCRMIFQNHRKMPRICNTVHRDAKTCEMNR